MAKQESASKSITLGVSWKNHLLGYAVSILLIPVFGLGLLGLFWVWKRQNRITYRVTDRQITSRDNQYQRNVDLLSIQKVEVHQNWLQEKVNVGDMELHTSASSMTLYGMEQPHQLKGVLQKAIAAEQKRNQQQEQTRPREPEYNPGSMERMDYLTGLWQQGLVSDEEYEEERKHFE